MKTTVNIDDTVMVELKREAARQGRTISELVEPPCGCCSALNDFQCSAEFVIALLASPGLAVLVPALARGAGRQA